MGACTSCIGGGGGGGDSSPMAAFAAPRSPDDTPTPNASLLSPSQRSNSISNANDLRAALAELTANSPSAEHRRITLANLERRLEMESSNIPYQHHLHHHVPFLHHHRVVVVGDAETGGDSNSSNNDALLARVVNGNGSGSGSGGGDGGGRGGRGGDNNGADDRLVLHMSSPGVMVVTRASTARMLTLASLLLTMQGELQRDSLQSTRAEDVQALETMTYCGDSNSDKNVCSGDGNADVCHVCLCEYEDGEQLRILPCKHRFHVECIDKWLLDVHHVCPVCRRDVVVNTNNSCNNNVQSMMQISV